MIVLDASVLLELLLNTPIGRAAARHLADPAVALHVPHLADIEVTQALRRYVREDRLSPPEAVDALNDLRALGLHRHAHDGLLDRVWELRDNLTAYDAVYVALAEVLDAPLLTCDTKIARASGVSVRVIVP